MFALGRSVWLELVAVTAIVEMFFLFLMLVHKNPFAQFLTEAPTEGAGLNPLLQNFYMAIHPPTMYLGFVGLTIPFAFGLAALISRTFPDFGPQVEVLIVAMITAHELIGPVLTRRALQRSGEVHS